MVKYITLPDSYYKLEKNVGETLTKGNVDQSELPQQVTDTNNMFDEIYNEFGGENATSSGNTDNNLYLVDERAPVAYYQTQNSQTAINNMNAAKK